MTFLSFPITLYGDVTFEGKCTKIHIDIVWWYDHDPLYESLHICMQMYIYEIPSLGDNYLDPSLWRQLKGKIWVPLLGGSYMGLSLWRQLKKYNVGPFTRRQLHIGSLPVNAAKNFEIPLPWRHVAKWDPSKLEAHGSPCGLVLCDDGHELSSLLD